MSKSRPNVNKKIRRSTQILNNTHHTASSVLQLINLSKIYNGRINALKNVNLSIGRGDFFGLLGMNGSGKTTALRIISSLVNPTSGKVYINGFNAKTNPYKARMSLGVMPQEINLHHFETPFNTIMVQGGLYGIPQKTIKRKAIWLLKKVSLINKKDTPIRFLSGGMKRRVMLARSLIHEPQLLLLDEPTAGIDIELREQIWSFLKQMNQQGLTIILTTHYLEEAEQLCNKIAVLNKGVLLSKTITEKIVPSLRRKIYIMKFKKAIDVDSIQVNGMVLKKIDKISCEVEINKKISMSQVCSEFSCRGIEITEILPQKKKLERLLSEIIQNRE